MTQPTRACAFKHPNPADFPDCSLCRWWTLHGTNSALSVVVTPNVTPTVPITYGPGTELTKLLKEYGAYPKNSCQCNSRAAQMDKWGVTGCREHMEEIVQWLNSEWKRLGALDKLKVAARAIAAGFIHPIDPARALVVKAIELAEETARKKAEKLDENPLSGSL